LRFELSAYEPSPQIPDTHLLTGVLWPVGRLFNWNPITLLRRLIMNSDPENIPGDLCALKTAPGVGKGRETTSTCMTPFIGKCPEVSRWEKTCSGKNDFQLKVSSFLFNLSFVELYS